ncbi:MAG TPA: L,D-transpeptidase family protein [Gemmatimonadaceae bacterium]|nr:L,D-transpeptidase family protein [Gemmatimonadaceae bacterium]
MSGHSVRRSESLLTITMLMLALCVGAPAHAQVSSAELRKLRASVEAGTADGAQHGDLARYRAALLRIYADTTSPLLWIAQGRPRAQASAMVAELSDAAMRGLDPADYDADRLATRLHDLRAASPVRDGDSLLLRADAWLTLSAMRYIDHARAGRVDPAPLGFVIPTKSAPRDFAAILPSLSRVPDVRASIDSLEPPYDRFRALEKLLHRYRTLSADSSLGDLPDLASPLHPQDRWEGTSALRRLLAALGDTSIREVSAASSDTDLYTPGLVENVKHFQASRGLSNDGVIGKATLRQLRTSIVTRIAQIELTMERWRWLPDPAASRLLVVNIPEFRLYALERNANRVLARERMDVIVGSAFNGRRTPVLASSVRAVVFHPYWDVPLSIARREEIPKIRRDSSYAAREGMEIVRGIDAAAVRFPITPVNLQRVLDGTLRLRQRPGPRNALGNVKFVFPNAYNVYLHDTPLQSLFTHERRDFSHGCIRASDPEGLAAFVLADEEGWEREHIEASIANPELRTVTLKHPVPIFVVYATVIANPDGTSSFLPDLYGHDAALARALAARATSLAGMGSSVSIAHPSTIP